MFERVRVRAMIMYPYHSVSVCPSTYASCSSNCQAMRGQYPTKSLVSMPPGVLCESRKHRRSALSSHDIPVLNWRSLALSRSLPFSFLDATQLKLHGGDSICSLYNELLNFHQVGPWWHTHRLAVYYGLKVAVEDMLRLVSSSPTVAWRRTQTFFLEGCGCARDWGINTQKYTAVDCVAVKEESASEPIDVAERRQSKCATAIGGWSDSCFGGVKSTL